MWALGLGAGRAAHDSHRRLCAELFQRGLPATVTFTSPRAWAFSLIGLHEYTASLPATTSDKNLQEVSEARNQLVRKLIACWDACSAVDWPWFENIVSYENARLCQALILAGKDMDDAAVVQIGLDSLRWLAGVQKTGTGYFRPIGSNGFLERGGNHAEFDQQPVEAQAMVAACLDAYRITQDDFWWREARRAFEWFLGRNDLGIPLHDPASGGCRDGLHHNRANENQGAESTLAFQIALTEMTAAEHSLTHPTLAHA
jgi:hypothetical protein